MHGDFSRWDFDFRTNDHGLLHQQGKVLLDQDVNALTTLAVRWQIEAARAAFGNHVVAVPDERREAFAIRSARADDAHIWLTIEPGRVFCDGALAYLETPDPFEWRIDADGVTDGPTPGARDAVVLECWHEGLSGFQDPRLLEPALGGPDTAVRAHLTMALRLIRLGPDEHCRDVSVDDDTGNLTVALDPATVLGDEDCPVEDAGGYRGVNHHLYRIEIAATNDEVGRFKWSRYNGGLVGRGRFSVVGGTPRLELRANQRAIASSGLTSVYVEALAYDGGQRRWKVVYGARGSIANDHEIDLAADWIVGDGLPGPPETDYFVRIWDGIELIGTGAHALGDGINATFTGGGAYPPATYWTFPVRAGLPNPTTLLDNARAHGPGYLRAPLGVLTWSSHTTVNPEDIEDCRRPFGPLTRRDGCCTIRVGDGNTSIGDVQSLQDAIDRLPAEGGTICVLPGIHAGGAHLRARRNVTIHGCGAFSVIRGLPADGDGDPAPALRISGGGTIRIEDLAIVADDRGIGLLVDRDNATMCRGLAIERVLATGAGPSAIDIDDAEDVLVRDCEVMMADRVVDLPTGRWPALTVLAIDARIEHNRIGVAVVQGVPQAASGGGLVTNFTIRRERLLPARAGLGGLWLRGGCEHLAVVDNRIESGIGHGIILGHVVSAEPNPATPWRFGWLHGFGDPCDPCGDGTIIIVPGLPGSEEPAAAGPPLIDIVIDGNEILTMGMAGISVYGFFGDDFTPQILVTDLRVRANRISGCLRRSRAPLGEAETRHAAFAAVVLANVADLDLRDNRIDGNGLGHDGPVCAVYAWSAGGVEIRDNTIERNGVRTMLALTAQGSRGGIWIERATQGLTVEGNRIEAAIGPAVRVHGLGPVAVRDNRLSSSGANDVHLLVDVKIGRLLIDDLNAAVAFTDNQTWFDAHGVTTVSSVISLQCKDGDLEFADNRCILIGEAKTLLCHVWLFADSVRFTASRLTEPTTVVRFSAIVEKPTRLGTVTLNQTDHCLACRATVLILRDNIENGGIDLDACRILADDYFDPLI